MSRVEIRDDEDDELILLWHRHPGHPYAHCHRHHHHQKHHDTQRVLFSMTAIPDALHPGESLTRDALAVYENPDGPGTFLTDANSPTMTYSADDNGAVVALVDNGVTASGTSSYTVTYVGPGTVTVSCTVTDPDGSTITSADAAITCAEVVTPPPPSGDATQVNFS